MQELISRIISQHANIQPDLYQAEFVALYEFLWKNKTISDSIRDEILFIESKRLTNHTCESALSNARIVEIYSKIAFMLARERCSTDQTFKIAKHFADLVSDFSRRRFLKKRMLAPQEMRKMKSMISEAVLDFKYAAGNDNATSFRMIPLVRSKHRKNEV